MHVTLDPATRRRIEARIQELCDHFGRQFDRAQIEALMNDSVQRLAGTASVHDFIPIMAFRLTRERLGALAPTTRSRGPSPTRSSGRPTSS